MTTFDMFESSVAPHTHFYNLGLLFYQFKAIEIKFHAFSLCCENPIKSPACAFDQNNIDSLF